MEKTLFSLLLATVATISHAEVCLGASCSGDEGREKQIAAEVAIEVARAETLLTEGKKEGFHKSQQLWEQFIKTDCGYNHSLTLQNISHHRCTMQHYRLRLEELKRRNDFLEKQIERMDQNRS